MEKFTCYKIGQGCKNADQGCLESVDQGCKNTLSYETESKYPFPIVDKIEAWNPEPVILPPPLPSSPTKYQDICVESAFVYNKSDSKYEEKKDEKRESVSKYPFPIVEKVGAWDPYNKIPKDISIRFPKDISSDSMTKWIDFLKKGFDNIKIEIF